MRNNGSKLLAPGPGVLALVVSAGLVLTWLLLNPAASAGITVAALFLVALILAGMDGWHQTTRANLASRGITGDDAALRITDHGLRRDFAPMLPVTPGRRVGHRSRERPGAPAAAPARPAPSLAGARAAPPPGRRGPAREGRTRPHGDLLPPGSRITLAAESRDAGTEDLLAQLDRELIGLLAVKKKVAEIGSLLLVDRARQRFGLPAARPNLHMCFTGAPGTGKTTVALMMADLLHRLGYLPRGHLVHAMRDDLVAEYIGQTAPKTHQVLERAKGGVLFIDEAYSLYRTEDSRDYGQESVEILMQVMENDRDNLVVILAGYKDRMDRFFESNPGMRSRVAHHLDFAPYQTDELLAIGQLMLNRSSYYLSDAASTALRDYLGALRGQPEFANARSVRNTLEVAWLRHAHRLAAEPERPWTRDDLMRLEATDVLPDEDDWLGVVTDRG